MTRVKIHRADYIKSAPSLKDCPDFEDTPEVVLVGRSNVGKSSFINSLTSRKNLARTSNTPGKTRYINFYSLAYSLDPPPSPTLSGDLSPLILVDLPGYGYAKVSKKEQDTWRRNLENYLLKRSAIHLVIQLIDARHGPQDNDIQMFEWLQHHGRRVMVILTKADKISRNEASRQAAQTARALDEDVRQLLVYSSETHALRDAAWTQIRQHLADSALQPQSPAPVTD